MRYPQTETVRAHGLRWARCRRLSRVQLRGWFTAADCNVASERSRVGRRMTVIGRGGFLNHGSRRRRSPLRN